MYIKGLPVATAFIVTGLLTWAYPSWGGLNWIIGGVAALVAGYLTMDKTRK